MQNRIDTDLAALHRIVANLEAERREFTAEDIAGRFLSPERHVQVIEFMHGQIRFLSDCGRFGTAMNYTRAADSLSEFLAGRELRFSEVTPLFAEQYGNHLMRKGMLRNSLSFHMRILRAVYNKAVRLGYAEQSFPFRDVYTGIDRTKKRAVGEDIISRIIETDTSDNERLSFAKDIFLFSFYTRGMAFVDIAYLRKSDIRDGVMRYARRKTGQRLAVRIEPCMKEIMDRYAPLTAGSPYVFPILKGEDSGECFSMYKSELRLYNHRLKHLSRRIGLGCGISSYTPRHSWATMARNRNIPISVISAGMGHSSERTTQIYLASIEDSLVDNANRSLIEAFVRPHGEV